MNSIANSHEYPEYPEFPAGQPQSSQVAVQNATAETASAWWVVAIAASAAVALAMLVYQLVLAIGIQSEITRFEALQLSWDNNDAERSRVLNQWKQLRSELKNQADELKTSVASREGDFTALESSVANLTTSLATKRSELATTLETLSKAQLDLVAAQKDKTLTDVLKRKTKEQRDKLLEQWRAANSNNKALETTIEVTKSALTREAAALATAESQLRGKQDELTRLDLKLQAAQATFAKLSTAEQQRNVAEESTRAAKTQLVALNEEAARAQGVLQANQKINLEQIKELEQNKQLVAAMKEEIITLQEEIERLTATLRDEDETTEP
jgi:chromosome segregation ATPase